MIRYNINAHPGESTAKEHAMSMAQELKKAVGGDWTAHVWFDGYWRVAARLGTVQVTVLEFDDHESTYTARVLSDNFGDPPFDWDENKSYLSASEAVINAIQHAETYSRNAFHLVGRTKRQTEIK